MINEFFKSIFRTLGRIAAYILLGILAYFIFSWFGSERVKAETINVDKYRIESINSSFGIGQYVYYGASMYPNNNYIVQGFQWLPVTGSSSSQTNIPLEASSYSIDVSFVLDTADLFTINKLDTTLPWFYMFVNRNVAATCDGNETFTKVNKIWNGLEGGYDYIYRYQCSQLDVTQNFNNIMFRVIVPGLDQLEYPQAIQYFGIQFSSIIDKNENSADTNAIISANNQNTQTIISNNNQNTQTIINNNNQNTTTINNSIEDIEDILNDDSDADVSILFDIEDYMPSDTPITNLLLLPINLLNATYNGLNGTCQAWEIPMGSFFNNYSLTFPCINLAHRFGNQSGWTWQGLSLWEIIDYMFSIYMIYNLAMLVIAAYTKISSLVDPWEELYIPQHAYVPKHSNYSDYYLGG